MWVCECVCVCVYVCVHMQSFEANSFATPWTVACQVPLSVEFSRQEYQSGLPFPIPGVLPDLGMEPSSLTSPALAGRFFTTNTTWKTTYVCMCVYTYMYTHTHV